MGIQLYDETQPFHQHDYWDNVSAGVNHNLWGSLLFQSRLDQLWATNHDTDPHTFQFGLQDVALPEIFATVTIPGATTIDQGMPFDVLALLPTLPTGGLLFGAQETLVGVNLDAIPSGHPVVWNAWGGIY